MKERIAVPLFTTLICFTIAAIILVGIYWLRDYPLFVFLAQLFLLIVVAIPVGFIVRSLGKNYVKGVIADAINMPNRAWLPKWFGFRSILILGHFLIIFLVGIVITQIEQVMGANPMEWWKTALYFVASFAVTTLLAWIILYVTKKLVQLAFIISIRLQGQRLAFLQVRGIDSSGAYVNAEVAVRVLLAMSFVLIPTIVIFSERYTAYILFTLTVIIVFAPVLVLLRQRRNLPIALFFELPRMFIPLQIVLGMTICALTVLLYPLLYYIRFGIAADMNITIPFNIPRVFDTMFSVEPFSPFFLTLTESVFFAVAIGVVVTWMYAAIMRRAWSQLITGMLSGLILFSIPYILNNEVLYKYVIPNFSLIHPFILAVIIPIVASALLAFLVEKVLPRGRTCPSCFYDGMDIYSLFCPRCGTSQPDSPFSESNRK